MTATEVANKLKVSRRMVRRLADAGVLPFVPLGSNTRRYRPDDVEALITSQRSTPQ